MKHILHLLCLFASFTLSVASARAEATLPFCINEICASNSGHYTIRNSAPDYVELHNLTDQPLSLDGFFISDDEDHLQQFPLDGYSIRGNGYFILAADKKELPFKLSASGGDELFLSDADGNILQRVSLPPLEKDETYSLQRSGEWQLTDPTPLHKNAEGVPYMEKAYVASPRFSHVAGFYDEPFDLTLDGYKTYKLYYTTDGSVPDENSTLYTGPIHIEDATDQPNNLSMRTDITIDGATPPSGEVKKATIIRAVAVDPNGNRSNEVTGAFFVGFQNYQDYQDISVLSIVADPGDLFDEDDGIYVVGKMYRDWLNSSEYSSELRAYDRPRNYAQRGKEWEIPAAIQFFDKEEKLCFTQNVGLRIHGNMTRENAQKAMNLYARKEYGESTFQYPLIDGVRSMKKVVVRGQAGRDSLAHGMLRETGLPVSGCTPCLVFINGEFWGFYELREKQNEDYLSDLFGIDKNSLMVYKNYSLIAGTDERGRTDSSVYKNFVADIIAHNPATDKGYTYACGKMDMDNYITYMAMILYCNNEDMRSNKTLWRTITVGSSPYEDARWRWIVQDMDGSIHRTDGIVEAIQIATEDELFMSLLAQPVFRRQLLTRIMDLANVELTPEYVEAYISPILDYYQQYFAINDQRWSGAEKGDQQISSQRFNTIMSFFRKRKDDVIERFQSILEITDQIATLSVSSLPDSLKLTVNGHTVHMHKNSWEGSYYIGSEVILTAEQFPGYRFLGWYEGDQLISEEKTVIISVDNDYALTPMFEEFPSIVCMDSSNQFSGTGDNGFSKRLANFMDWCIIQPDPTVTAERASLDHSIRFCPDDSVNEPQGFTLTLPLDDYLDCGVIFTVSVPYNSTPFTWSIRYRDYSGAYQPLPVDCVESPGGMSQLSCSIPKEQTDQQFIDIRLEAEPINGSSSFSLHSLKVYGIPMDATLAKAYEYSRIANSIDAPAQYLPDLDEMAGWSADQIEDEIVTLRHSLQTALTEKALTTVESLRSEPAWESLETYPALVIDKKISQAYYNTDDIKIPYTVSNTVYIYEAKDHTLSLKSIESSDGNFISIRNLCGIFFLLDKPVEEIRYHAMFDTAQISNVMVRNKFFGIEPDRYLWMNIETFTRYQEETSFDLPETWLNQNVFIYRVQEEELEFFGEKTATDGMIRMQPAAGRYLLLDKPLESFAEEAEWEQKRIAEHHQLRELEELQRAQTAHTLLIISCVFTFLILAGIAAAFISHRRKK